MPSMLRQAVLLTVVLVAVMPTAQGFFWACNVRQIDMPTDRNLIKEYLDGLFPAFVYLRKVSNGEERRYSCIEIEIDGQGRKEDRNITRNGAAEATFLQRDDDAVETQDFTGKIKFMESQEQDEVTVQHTRVFTSDHIGITFDGVPVTMFQAESRSSKASLTLSVLTEEYGVFDACVTGFLAFSNTRSSYMFMNDYPKTSDYRCMADGLEEITGVGKYEPAGIC